MIMKLKAEARALGGCRASEKRYELTGEWGKLHKEKLHKFYSSPNTVRILKSRKITCIWEDM
jgi:hypothetical protein